MSKLGETHLGQNGQLRNFVAIEEAAGRLSMSPDALRARCRRNARGRGRDVIARIGPGVTAFKFGRSWRIRFDT